MQNNPQPQGYPGSGAPVPNYSNDPAQLIQEATRLLNQFQPNQAANLRILQHLPNHPDQASGNPLVNPIGHSPHGSNQYHLNPQQRGYPPSQTQPNYNPQPAVNQPRSYGMPERNNQNVNQPPRNMSYGAPPSQPANNPMRSNYSQAQPAPSMHNPQVAPSSYSPQDPYDRSVNSAPRGGNRNNNQSSAPGKVRLFDTTNY